MTTENTLTTRDAEAQNILNAAREGANKILKFKKGKYVIGDDPVPLGTEYLAHAAAWTKTWIKFADGKVADRKLYRVTRGEKPPHRDELDDLEEAAWPLDHNGNPSDPWVFQYLLPLENLATGEVAIFVTPSVGGRQAVSDLCREYANRALKGQGGQPIVRLGVGEMPTKNFGKVLRPDFKVVRWDDAASDSVAAEASLTTAIPVEAAPKKAAAKRDIDDEIPF